MGLSYDVDSAQYNLTIYSKLFEDIGLGKEAQKKEEETYTISSIPRLWLGYRFLVCLWLIPLSLKTFIGDSLTGRSRRPASHR
jgi:hypothetical protein